MRNMKFFGIYTPGVRVAVCSVLLLIYVTLLVLVYRYDVVGNGLYFSFGFESDYLAFISLIAWFLGLSTVLFIGNFSRVDSAYKLFCLLFILMVAIPVVLFADMLEGDFYGAIVVDFSVVAVLLALVSRVSFSGIGSLYKLPLGLYYVPLFSCFAFLVYMLFLYPGDIVMVGPDEVYGLRESAKDYQSSLFQYGQGFILGAAAPFCLVFGIYKKSLTFLALAFASYLLVYMSSGHKSAVLTIFIITFVYIFAERLSAGMILTVAILGMSLLLIMDLFVFEGRLASFTYDRMIAAPAVLSILYYEYFEEAPKFLLSHSVFSEFFNNPYEVTPQQVIGSAYFSDDWANVNFVGEGFANFGRLGVYLYLMVVIFLVRVFDYVSRDLPLRVRLSLFVPVLMFLLNASPLTLMLTGGYVGFIFVLFFRKAEMINGSRVPAN